MPGLVAIEVMGAEMLAQELVRAGDRAGDMTDFWPGVKQRMYQIEREQFATDGRRGPRGPWPENEPFYQFSKFRNDQSLEPLRATEVMMNVLTGKFGGSDKMWTETHDMLTWNVDLDQFAIAQSGSQPHPNEGRQRYPIDLSDEDVREFAELMMEHILMGLGNGPGPGGGYYAIGKSGRKYYAKRDATGRFAK